MHGQQNITNLCTNYINRGWTPRVTLKSVQDIIKYRVKQVEQIIYFLEYFKSTYTYLLAYLITYLLHAAESILRS